MTPGGLRWGGGVGGSGQGPATTGLGKDGSPPGRPARRGAGWRGREHTEPRSSAQPRRGLTPPPPAPPDTQARPGLFPPPVPESHPPPPRLSRPVPAPRTPFQPPPTPPSLPPSLARSPQPQLRSRSRSPLSPSLTATPVPKRGSQQRRKSLPRRPIKAQLHRKASFPSFLGDRRCLRRKRFAHRKRRRSGR